MNSIYDDSSMPVGFGMALAMNPTAMDSYSHLTESKKEELLNRARDTKSKRELDRIVAELKEDSIKG